MIIGDQVKEDALDVIAETAALGIDAAQVAVQKAIGEVLERSSAACRVGSTEQIAADSSAVEFQRPLLGGGDVRRRCRGAPG